MNYELGPKFEFTPLEDLIKLASNLQILSEEGQAVGELEDVVWNRIREEIERQADEQSANR